MVTLNPLKKRRIGTVGRPLPGVRIDIRNDDGTPVQTGTVGEIWVKGDNVMVGYFKKSRETNAVLTADGWLKTGDLGKLDGDNYLTIMDRKKDLIIVKGLNVYPQEIESVILLHPRVKEAAVVGKPDPKTGEEIIKAYVTLKDKSPLDIADIMTLCKTHLAPYKRPKSVSVLEALPKNAFQKVLKKELRHW